MNSVLSEGTKTLTGFVKPEPAGLDREQIEQLANQVALDLGYQPGRTDLPDLVESLGGKINYLGYEEWSNNEMNFVRIDQPGDFTIQLLSVDGANRHNFTLAHELGHYIIHSESGEIAPMKVNHSGHQTDYQRVEWEANNFALSFLMPEKLFREACKEFGSDLALAGRFMVSLSAVNARKEILEIKTH